MLKKVFELWVVIFLCSPFAFSQNRLALKEDQQGQRWADSVYSAMSEEERIGQLFVVEANMDGKRRHLEGLRKTVSDYHIGGIVFSAKNNTVKGELVKQYQDLSRIPLLIGMFGEPDKGFGPKELFEFSSELVLGAVADTSYMYRVGGTAGLQMKNRGVHIGLLKEDAVQRSILLENSAYVQGISNNDILITSKSRSGTKDQSAPLQDDIVVYHAPNPVTSSSSIAKKVINNSIVLDNAGRYFINLPGKKSKEGGRLIMADLPYMLEKSPPIKEKAGLEITSFLAGNDMLLFSENIALAIKVLKKAVRKRKNMREQLEEIVKRILLFKYNLGLDKAIPSGMYSTAGEIISSQPEIFKRELLKSAITVVKNKRQLLPFHMLDTLSFASVTLNDKGETFTSYLNKYSSFVNFQEQKPYSSLAGKLGSFDVVIAGVFGKRKNGDDIQLNQNQIDFLKELNRKTNLVLVIFGPPDVLQHFEGFEQTVCAYTASQEMMQLVPQALFGAIPASGRLPISPSENIPQGTGIDTRTVDRLQYGVPESVGMDGKILKKIDDVFEEAIRDHATPGGQVLVAKNGKVVFEKAYGYKTYDSLKPVTTETIYDIASITKVAATVQAMMFLEERGMVDLDKKISFYLPELKASNKKDMIFRDVLTHQAGLIPYVPFWKMTVADTLLLPEYYSSYPKDNFVSAVAPGIYTLSSMRDSLWHWTVSSDLRKKSYKKPYDYKYSDMGYYMLQRLADKLLNQPMEMFLAQNIYEPLGLNTLGYQPLCRFPAYRIAPTEYDKYFRDALICGWVHDQGAAMFGGAAGHAGLFSNANDLAKLMQMHLQDGYYGGMRYYQQGTVERFTSKQYENNRRGLGWDKPLSGEWYGPTSEYASPKTFGHTGFTGTAVWVDPEFDLIYVFLSNRIYPDATNTKLIKNNIRTRIQDIIYKSMWSYQAPLSN